MEESTRTLRSGFLASCERVPDRPALEVDGEILSYKELQARAAAIAATVARMNAAAGEVYGVALTAVYARRSVTSFTGILASLRG